MFQISVVSLLPEIVEPVIQHGVIGRACAKGLIDVVQVSPRDFVSDIHRTVDARPYGGRGGAYRPQSPRPIREEWTSLHSPRRRHRLMPGRRSCSSASGGYAASRASSRRRCRCRNCPGISVVCRACLLYTSDAADE